MLKQLHIQNIAVISKAAVAFSEGLNVFTGETGAGKTIMISAIDAVLGERTSKEIIRSGEDAAQVSALFEDISPRAGKALEELGYSDDEGSVLISREIQAGGKTSCRINGMPATVSILKSVSSLLINIHGQRDSMQLLAGEQHLHMIDAFGQTEKDLEKYKTVYTQMRALEQELSGLEMDDARKAQRIDMLRFQIEEIEAASLEDPGEEEVLHTRRKMIKNSEKILESLSTSYDALSGNGEAEGINGLIDLLTANTIKAAEFIEALAPMASRVEEIGYELAEYAQDIRSALDEFEFDPRELDSIEARLDTIYRLKHKYGADISEILTYLAEASRELEAITTSEERALRLARELSTCRQQAVSLAAVLSQKRERAAARFVRQVEEELKFLDMPSVRLSAQRREKELSPRGADDLELFIVTNVGEQPKPLSKIASGGELSRIMLAIKNVLAERDDVATLIFDEVDSGVSGRAAQKIGRKLAQVARDRQVICVTHLAQVAAFADNHLLISKEVEKGRTFTQIAALDEAGAVRELARITGGDLLTEATLQSARELRERSRACLDSKQVLSGKEERDDIV